MQRRQFLFRSLQAALLLSPVFSIRRAEAQAAPAPKKRAVFFVFSAGYPDEDAFFTPGLSAGSHTNFQLSPMLAGLAPVKENMIIVDGVDIRDSGLNPAGANHARSMGKVLTARDMIFNPNDSEGWPGDISIDQLLVRDLGLSSLELHVSADYARSIREVPFATGATNMKPPIINPSDAWDKVFQNFTPPSDPGPAREATLRRLRAKKSLLDGVGEDLKRLRAELSGIEKLKLDVHEDAIRRGEQSVSKDLIEVPAPGLTCSVPGRSSGDPNVSVRAKAHLDLLYASLICDRVQVGGVVWGGSGFSFRYDWLPGLNITDLHNDVHHMAGPQRDTYIRTAGWDWEQCGNFVKRLRDTPEGDGNMLDNTIVLGISHFSHHHDIRRLPVVLFGTAKGGLAPGRYLKQPTTVNNDRVHTSIANWMGLPINGFGDETSCGPLPLL